MFQGEKDKAKVSQSVFLVKPGQCFAPPGAVATEISDLTRVPCSNAHTEEAYAVVPFTAADGSTPTDFPGADALTNFAQGTCAQKFQDYVGISYLDSKLFFTYLVPSARGWQQSKDRNIVCFVTTTGDTLTASVKGIKR